MTGLSRATVLLGQANGTEVELVVSGTELYASYETVDGFPAVYDKGLGLFCYARLVAGRFQSTGTPVAEAPPPGVIAHAKDPTRCVPRKSPDAAPKWSGVPNPNQSRKNS